MKNENWRKTRILMKRRKVVIIRNNNQIWQCGSKSTNQIFEMEKYLKLAWKQYVEWLVQVNLQPFFMNNKGLVQAQKIYFRSRWWEIENIKQNKRYTWIRTKLADDTPDTKKVLMAVIQDVLLMLLVPFNSLLSEKEGTFFCNKWWTSENK